MKFTIVLPLILIFGQQALADLFDPAEIAYVKSSGTLSGTIDCKLKEILGADKFKEFDEEMNNLTAESVGTSGALMTGFIPGLGGMSGGAISIQQSSLTVAYFSGDTIKILTTEDVHSPLPAEIDSWLKQKTESKVIPAAKLTFENAKVNSCTNATNKPLCNSETETPEWASIDAQKAPFGKGSGYLVAGDFITISKQTMTANQSCAHYQNSSGKILSGLIDPKFVRRFSDKQRSIALSAKKADDWTGAWHAKSADLTITRHRDVSKLTGSALNGANDDVLDPAVLNFSGATAEAKDDTDNGPCLLKLTLFNNAMTVEQDRECGGLGVTFSGVYSRRLESDHRRIKEGAAQRKKKEMGN